MLAILQARGIRVACGLVRASSGSDRAAVAFMPWAQFCRVHGVRPATGVLAGLHNLTPGLRRSHSNAHCKAT